MLYQLNFGTLGNHILANILTLNGLANNSKCLSGSFSVRKLLLEVKKCVPDISLPVSLSKRIKRTHTSTDFFETAAVFTTESKQKEISIQGAFAPPPGMTIRERECDTT